MASFFRSILYLVGGLALAYSLGLILNSARLFRIPPRSQKIAVLITGCSSGLGLDLVREILEDDFHSNVEVFAGVRKPADIELLRKFPSQSRLHPLVLDVVNPAQVEAAVSEIEKSGVPLYALINNAGVSMPIKGLVTQPANQYVDAVQRVFDVNIKGLLRMSGASLPLLQKAASRFGSARIINVSSLMGVVFTPTCSGYCASKHALEAFSSDWRYQLEPYNISVSSLQPGFFKTNMCTESWCKDDPSVCSKVAINSIFSTRPRPRYQCASVFGIPGTITSMLVAITPDRIVDLVFRTFEALQARGAI